MIELLGRPSDSQYPSLAKSAFARADVLLRGEASPYFAKEKAHDPASALTPLIELGGIIVEMEGQEPFQTYSDPHSASVPDPLTEEERFGWRRPVWGIINEVADEVFHGFRRGALGTMRENAGEILLALQHYRDCLTYQKEEATFLKSLSLLGVRSVKVLDGNYYELLTKKVYEVPTLADRYSKDTNDGFLKCIALTANRLDAHYQSISGKSST